MGNVQGIIRNVIGVLVIMAALGVTWPLQMVAVDGFYKKFVNHCEANGVEYTRLYTRAADTDQLLLTEYIQFTFADGALTKDDCAGTAIAVDDSPDATVILVGSPTWAVGTTLYSEHNEQITGSAISAAAVGSATSSLVIANAAYETPMAILTKYASISTVILGAIPVLSSVTFIGAAGFNLYRNSGSNEGMVSNQVMYTIGALVAVIVVLFGMPILLGFFNFAYVASGGANIAGGGPWEATRQFGSIIAIVFEMSPILAILSSMSGFAYLGIKQYGGQARSAMGM